MIIPKEKPPRPTEDEIMWAADSPPNVSIVEEEDDFYLEQTFDDEKRKLWRDLVIAYTSSSNSRYVDKALQWADRIVRAYDKRYKDDDL